MNRVSYRQRVEGLKGPVAVLMGGYASEREISLQSGQAVVSALQSAGLDVCAVDTRENAIEQLQELRPSFAFIALHGVGGEDGSVQAVLERLSIPYSGSGVLGSALAMDKVRTKNLWRGIGLPTPAFELWREDSCVETVLQRLGGSVIVKPVADGSSMGMSIVDRVESLKTAIHAAQEYGSNVFVEKTIVGPEYTVAVLESCQLPSIKIETQRSFYNYDAKYVDDSTSFSVPSGLDEKDERTLQELAREAFDALGCRGWGRVDFMRDRETSEFYLLEVNTVPGLTSHSLVPMAARSAGLSFQDLIFAIIAIALEGERG